MVKQYKDEVIEGLKAEQTVCGMLVCWICQLPIIDDDWNIDHIKPKKYGGSNYKENLQITHTQCNTEKAATYQFTETEKIIHRLGRKNVRK